MNVYNEAALREGIRLLMERPHTVEELAATFQRSPKTVKRWMTEYRKRGYRVVRDGVKVDSPWYISGGT